MALFKRDLFEIGDEDPVGVASVWEQPLGDERRRTGAGRSLVRVRRRALPGWRASAPRRGDRAYGAFGDCRAADRCRRACDQPGGAGSRHRLKRARAAECQPPRGRAGAMVGPRRGRRAGSGPSRSRRAGADRVRRGTAGPAPARTPTGERSWTEQPRGGMGRAPRRGSARRARCWSLRRPLWGVSHGPVSSISRCATGERSPCRWAGVGAWLSLRLPDPLQRGGRARGLCQVRAPARPG